MRCGDGNKNHDAQKGDTEEMTEGDLDEMIALLEKGTVKKVVGDYSRYRDGIGYSGYGVSAYQVGDSLIRVDLKRK